MKFYRKCAVTMMFLGMIVVPLSAKKETALGKKDDPTMFASRKNGRRAILDEQSERADGRDSVGKINQETPILKDNIVERYLRKVVIRLVEGSRIDKTKFKFTVYVIDSPYVARFYVHGGFIYVTTGALAQAKTEDEVAYLLAQPMGHVLRRDWAAKSTPYFLLRNASLPMIFYSPYYIGLLFSSPLYVASGKSPVGLILHSYGESAPKREERTADSLAAQMLYNASYDPTSAISLDKRTREYISQHPEFKVPWVNCIMDDQRMNLLEEKIHLYPPRKASSDRAGDFVAFKDRLAEITQRPPSAENQLRVKITFELLTKEEKRELKEKAKEERKKREEEAREAVRQSGAKLRRSAGGHFPPLKLFSRPKRRGPGFDKEKMYGRAGFNWYKTVYPVLQDPKVNEFVNRIVQNLADAAHVKTVFQTVVIQDEGNDTLAFSLPGGFIGCNTGLIRESKDEAQLAGVLAHEIEHVASHEWSHYRRMETIVSLSLNPAMILEGSFLRGAENAMFGTAMGWQYGYKNLLSEMQRGRESRADRKAIEYLIKAGYDPEPYAEALRKIDEHERKSPYRPSPFRVLALFGSLRHDHPDTRKRIKKVEKLALLAKCERGRGKPPLIVNTEEFQKIKARVERIASDAEEDAQRPVPPAFTVPVIRHEDAKKPQSEEK